MILRILGAALLTITAFAQPDAPPRFDAAEVRVSKADVRSNVDLVNGQLRMTGVTMRSMITMAFAYTVKGEDLRGGPSWLDSDRFDVVAKTSGASEPAVFSMLQTLLVERFKLKTHLENESRLVYLLAVADTGSKLQLAAADEPPSCTPSTAGPERIHLACTNVTMGSLAKRLPLLTNLDLPMVDETELKGAYDFALDWTWGGSLDSTGQQKRPTPDGLSTSMKRIGLLFERRKHQVPVVVIESVERTPIE